eukprot:TRINITY_DN98158_c0_g1_i1.p1 TRINITY_DN98158_c0_g1~~TRINITY_DN98158_c0_g1_i1.p1  ORF type:complete len:365 (-),score=35.02 TRINITY_DN98158_c0_g1_i1:52-1146(-)
MRTALVQRGSFRNHCSEDSSVGNSEEGVGSSGTNEIADSLGVPWMSPDEGRRNRFLYEFYIKKVVAEGGYKPEEDSGHVVYSTRFSAEAEDTYPPPTFDRRLTLNNWRGMLAMSLLFAGARCITLQTNARVAFMFFTDRDYTQAPPVLRALFVGFFVAALAFWIALGIRRAIMYKDFHHPDGPMSHAASLAAAALLELLAVPADIMLIPIHMLPIQKGGLLCDSSCVQGNRKWPVHTIAHFSRRDHDYTNTSGISVQLPLFILNDFGCTILNVLTSISIGRINMIAVVQIGTNGVFALWALYEACMRCWLRKRLRPIWRQLASDPHSSVSRRQNAITKYLAEGGSRRKLEREVGQNRAASLSSA